MLDWSRIIARLALLPGSQLDVPWRWVVFAAVVGLTYQVFVRRLLGSTLRLTRFLFLCSVRTLCVLLLIPDRISTAARRSRGLSPSGWTYVVGEPVVAAEDWLTERLQKLPSGNRKKARVSIVVTLLFMALPVAAYNVETHGLTGAPDRYARKVLTKYDQFETWASK